MNKLAMIVAAAENEVIGINGDLPWQLSADLRRFKHYSHCFEPVCIAARILQWSIDICKPRPTASQRGLEYVDG